MNYPKLACPNLFADVNLLKSFAQDHGFHGIDWTFRPKDIPTDSKDENRLAAQIGRLAPLQIRYHLFFPGVEPGESNPEKAISARMLWLRALKLIHRLSGRCATVHLGLSRPCMAGISWEDSLTALRDLTAAARKLGIRLCLENLMTGWTAVPQLYEKLLRKTGCWGTLDIGHAVGCDSIRTQEFYFEDFTIPHPTRFLNTHIYHEETKDGHQAPNDYVDLESRLQMLMELPLCDWWVLELREEEKLLTTLAFVEEFLREKNARAAV